VTRDEAIAIRARQLQGGFVHADVLAEALEVLREPVPAPPAAAASPRRKQAARRADDGKARVGSAPRKVMELLKEEPKSLTEIRRSVPRVGENTLRYMLKRRWVEQAALLILTDEGREALK
jgi:hypothetical protein